AWRAPDAVEARRIRAGDVGRVAGYQNAPPVAGGRLIPRFGQPSTAFPRIRSEARSAIMIVGALVLPPINEGITDASITRRPCTPLTRNWLSTTQVSSLPMRQVPTGW